MKRLAALTLLSLSLTTFTGCSQLASQDSVTNLQQRISVLESENAMLKQQLTSMHTTTTTETITNVPMSHKTFSDLTDETPNISMLRDMIKLGLFDEWGDKFDPNKTVTRSEYITWLFKAYNKMHADKPIQMAPGYKLEFTDVTDKSPTYRYIQAFSNAGYSVGYEDKTFKPDKVITREEMIALKQGVDGGQPMNAVPLNFTDQNQIDKQFYNAIYSDTVYKNGPKGSNLQRAFGPVKTFKPKAPVTRYEAIATLWQTDPYGQVTAELALKPTVNTATKEH